MALTPQAFTSMPYDFLIAGGGTAGLVMAARLTEDPSVTVGVLEAGIDHTGDPNVLTPLDFLNLREKPQYDWNYTSIPQVYLMNQSTPQARGKGLGGSSAINYMMFTFAAQSDIDDWAALGNPGWDYATVSKYYKKFETYEPPPNDIALEADAAYVNGSAHGYSGPIHGSFAPFYTDVQRAWTPTYKGLGIGYDGDMRDGKSMGGYTNPMNQFQKDHTRSHAGNSYFEPNRNRPNLKVITSAFVNNIVFDSSDKSKGLKATGLNFTVNGTFYIAQAKKEVIVSGGVMNSPKILELSGIGNPNILQQFGIPLLYENKNVGENLQDHPQIKVTNQVNAGIITLDQYFNNTYQLAARQLYNTNRTGMLASGVTQNAPLSWYQVLPPSLQGRPKELIDKLVPGSPELQNPGYAAQYALNIKRLLDPAETYVCETMLAGTGGPAGNNETIAGNYVSRTAFLTRALSRGSIHIASADPEVYPNYDPNYLSHPLDIEMLADSTLHMQLVGQSAPLSSVFAGNGTVYGKDAPAGLTYDNVRPYIKKGLITGWHPVGTCAMEPEDKGGVVNPRLVVYGTQNVRVIDASIIPLHVRGNTQSVTYAIAEYGADIVKQDNGMPLGSS